MPPSRPGSVLVFNQAASSFLSWSIKLRNWRIYGFNQEILDQRMHSTVKASSHQHFLRYSVCLFSFPAGTNSLFHRQPEHQCAMFQFLLTAQKTEDEIASFSFPSTKGRNAKRYDATRPHDVLMIELSDHNSSFLLPRVSRSRKKQRVKGQL